MKMRFRSPSECRVEPGRLLQLPFLLAGGPSGAATPVPIPNTAVKGPCGDDTAFKSAGK